MTILAFLAGGAIGSTIGFLAAALAAAANTRDDFDRGYQAGRRTKDNP